MKITPAERQSLLDIAIQTSGSLEAAFALSVKNDLGLSEPLATDRVLETVAVADQLVLSRYKVKKLQPATAISPEDQKTIPYGGIGFMGIEVDFIVS